MSHCHDSIALQLKHYHYSSFCLRARGVDPAELAQEGSISFPQPGAVKPGEKDDPHDFLLTEQDSSGVVRQKQARTRSGTRCELSRKTEAKMERHVGLDLAFINNCSVSLELNVPINTPMPCHRNTFTRRDA